MCPQNTMHVRVSFLQLILAYCKKNHLRVKVGAYNGNPNYAYFKKRYYGIITLIFVYCSHITHFICKNCVYNKNHNP